MQSQAFQKIPTEHYNCLITDLRHMHKQVALIVPNLQIFKIEFVIFEQPPDDCFVRSKKF